jgi:hypothetical protein
MTRLRELSSEELRILATYKDPRLYGLARAVRLSIQYAIGALIFLCLAIGTENPWYAIGTYAIFLLYLFIRFLGAKQLAGIMPGIIAKYEKRLEELESLLPNDEQGG